MLRLKDKVAIITGAASGFGEGMATAIRRGGREGGRRDLNTQGASGSRSDIGKSAIAVDADRRLAERGEFDEMVEGRRWTRSAASTSWSTMPVTRHSNGEPARRR
jgi:3-oxoacyl-[acyl-carrier protein] reductase